jgi:uncharacterized membrane protein
MTESSRGEEGDNGKRRVALDDLVDSACLLLTAFLITVAVTGMFNGVRTGAVLVFAVFVPGWSLVTNWPSMRAKSTIASSVVLSLSLLTLVSLVALWIHEWNPVRILEGEAVVVEVLLIVGLARRGRADKRARAQSPLPDPPPEDVLSEPAPAEPQESGQSC